MLAMMSEMRGLFRKFDWVSRRQTSITFILQILLVLASKSSSSLSMVSSCGSFSNFPHKSSWWYTCNCRNRQSAPPARQSEAYLKGKIILPLVSA